MEDICFLDTETLGLAVNAPIWEIAAIRRTVKPGEEPVEASLHLFIHHDPEPWIRVHREDFVADYNARYDETNAFCRSAAARAIASFIGGATIVGAVPDFDTNRIRQQLLEPLSIPEPWHYHLIDVENLIVGYLVGVGTQAVNDGILDTLDMNLVAPPWSSDQLSRAVGVDPAEFGRHTAMGDVLWVKAQYDAVMGTKR